MESIVNHMASETQENFKKKMMEPTVLDSFSKLSVDSERERIEGGIVLLKHLLQLKNNVKDSKELTYTLDRLIRGIGSSRINARKGFYALLVALLSTMPVSATEVLNVLDSQLQTSSSCSKSEKADIYTGQILVCGAIIRSGLFVNSSLEDQQKIIEILLKASKQRSYLSLLGYTFVKCLIEKLSEENFCSILWPILKEEILKPWSEQTLDQIHILFIAHQKFPNVVKKKYLKKTLNAPSIIHEESVKPLCNLLMNIPLCISLQNPIYKIISPCLAESDCVEQWCMEVDNELGKPTRNKLLIAISMITYMLPHLKNISLLPNLLTTNFVRQLIKTLPSIKQKKDDEMNTTAINFFSELVAKFHNESIAYEVKLSVIKKLLFYPGHFMFEKITSTKVIQQIIATLDIEGVKKLSEIFRDVICTSKPKLSYNNVSDVWLNAERAYAADLLNKLLTHSSVQNENQWRKEQVIFLLDLGLFNVNCYSGNTIGTDLAASIKKCFFHSLDQKLPKLIDLRNLLSSLVHHINEKLISPDDNEKLRSPLSEESLTAWNKMFSLVIKLENVKKQNFAIPVFHTLLLHMGLQLFVNPQLAKNTLEELHSCFDRIKSNKSKKGNTVERNEESDEPLWTEVIIDLFLNLLSQESHLFRSIIKCVFPHLCSHISSSAIHQILSVLNPNNNKNPLLDDDLSHESETDEDSNKSDEENVEAESELSESDEESDIEEDIDEEETVTDKLRMAVQQALRGAKIETDDESVDLDEMDDEEGIRLDKALAEAFKSVKGKTSSRSKKQSQVDKTLTHFRIKTIDLIEMYLDSEPSLSITLEIMLPLLQTLEFAIRDEHQKPLEMRIRSCLKKLSMVKKFNNLDNVNQNMLSQLLKSLINRGERSASIFQDMGDKISDCCVFIIRCSQMLYADKSSKRTSNKSHTIIDVLKEALAMFFQKRDCLLPVILFRNTLQLNWEGNWQLVSTIMDFTFDPTIRPFRRNQALELMLIFYRNHRLLKSDVERNLQELSKIEQNLSQKSLSILEKVATNPKDTTVKEKFVCLLMNLLQTIKNFHVQLKINDNIWNWEAIGVAIRSYRSGVSLAVNAKKSYNRLCTALGISSAKIILNDTKEFEENKDHICVTEISELSECALNPQRSKNKKNKKIQKSKAVKSNMKKLKKEAQELRMKAMSEGLGTILFSNIPNTEIENSQDKDDVLLKTNNKRKKSMEKEVQDEDSLNSEQSSVDLNAGPRKKLKMKKS